MKSITPKRVVDIWATDIAILPESHGGEELCLLVIMEYLSRWVVVVPLKSFEAGSIVQVLLYAVVLKYGLPARLISDNGSNYIAEAMAMVCKHLGTSRSLTSVEHAQSDSLVRRINRTLKTSLAIVVGGDMKSWAMHLPFVVFAYNTSKQSSTKFSPFQVMLGGSATLPLLTSLEVNQEANYNTRQWLNFLNEENPVIHAKAIENIKKAQEQQQLQYNKKPKDIVRFKTGDLVLGKNHSKMMAFPKERWLGPWQIVEATNKDGSAYRIMKPGDVKTLFKVNVVDLKPFHRRGDDVMVR